jgi:hypothetical protein
MSEDNSWSSRLAVAALVLCVVRGVLHESFVEHNDCHASNTGMITTKMVR